ncbi:hypothetical protein [Prolixibacter denitrificans]|uniref:Uncharacterized protein n=1 Tax=Prolixibacter denitrificans TaxID=1541063 RepID=A0A2P8CJZ3_9BACT|nr:hypothetical protein [Prolixibacter denitrificans]PSK85265.1 hypothetical protein CLV93_101217 [Prolixibacter denitrificans]GET19887.1 hypothetical protein JCM18694_01330 [Prolixibacter denitrificans]
MITATEAQLERIFRRIYTLGERNGAEKVLVEQGKIPDYIRRTEAKKRIGPSTYAKLVKKGFLHERKMDSSKPNSPIVIPRDEFNYVQMMVDNPTF